MVVFGETGAGKSSVVNMLEEMTENPSKAPISNRAVGVTFQNKCYSRQIGSKLFNVYDTAGLNEGAEGQVPADQAIPQLYELLYSLEGGVNLLILVLQGRITKATKQNYEIFYDILCRRRVPIVIIITGLENDEDVPDMEKWWVRNANYFKKYGMKFEGHACVTTLTSSRDPLFPELHKASKSKIEKLILDSYERNKTWRASTRNWVETSVDEMLSLFGIPRRYKQLSKTLVDQCGFDEDRAEKFAKELEKREMKGK